MDPDEVIRLWVEGGLNTTEIASKVGVTHQRVSGILAERQIPRGPKRVRRRIKGPDSEQLRRLYVVERKPACQIAGELDVSTETVRKWLDECQIPRRKVGEDNVAFPELREMKVGDTITVPKIESPGDKRAWIRYYSMARLAGIRVSLRTVDEVTFELTRLE